MAPIARSILRVFASAVAGGVVFAGLASPAQAAVTLPSATVEGGNAAVKSGTSIRITYPPLRGLAAGVQTANRSVHARIVRGLVECENQLWASSSKIESGINFADLNLPVTFTLAIPSRNEIPNIEDYYVCAFQIAEAPFNGQRYLTRDLWRIQPNAAANALAPTLPGTPVLVSGGNATGIPVNNRIIVSGALIAPPPAGDSLILREITTSIVNSPTVERCSAGSAVTKNNISRNNLGVVAIAVTYPTGQLGQYLCVDQSVATNSYPAVRNSTPLTLRITSNIIRPGLSNPTPNLQEAQAGVAAALSRAQEAARNLANILANQGANAPAVQAAVEEARVAEEQLQAAQAQQAAADPGNAINQGGSGGVVVASDAATTAASDQLRQQLEAALGGATVTVAPGIAPTLVSLAAATGFDPLSTPVLAQGKGNSAGISLSLTKPVKIKRGKDFYVTLKVNPAATRGGMRQYLLRLDGDQPTLVQKRSGFITTGERVKRYKVSPKDPKGTYAILSTFQPSVPGTPGLALITPITIK